MSLEQQKHEEMPRSVSYPEKTFIELEGEGWEEAFSFHSRVTKQWNMAVEVARNLLKENEDWDIAIVNDNTKEGRQDSVKYLYKKKKTK
jgi:hypothetical protein